MLAGCLKSLCGVDYPDDRWEVIVVDDGSQQSLQPVVSQYSGVLSLRLVSNEIASGPATVRNIGARLAKGDYLVFLDDDCCATPHWLKCYAAGFRETQKNALGGSSLSSTPEKAGARAWHHLVTFLYTHRRDAQDNVLIIISNNCAYEREVFFEIGGFDGTFPYAGSEDRDISWRLLEHGYTQAHYAEAQVWHIQPHLSMIRYVMLQFKYGRSASQFRKRLNPVTTAQFSERFGIRTRICTAFQLVGYSIHNRLSPVDAVVLFAGHMAHWLGTLYEDLTTVRIPSR